MREHRGGKLPVRLVQHAWIRLVLAGGRLSQELDRPETPLALVLHVIVGNHGTY